MHLGTYQWGLCRSASHLTRLSSSLLLPPHTRAPLRRLQTQRSSVSSRRCKDFHRLSGTTETDPVDRHEQFYRFYARINLTTVVGRIARSNQHQEYRFRELPDLLSVELHRLSSHFCLFWALWTLCRSWYAAFDRSFRAALPLHEADFCAQKAFRGIDGGSWPRRRFRRKQLLWLHRVNR